MECLLYHFYFTGADHPVTIEAPNIETARTLLKENLQYLKEFKDKEVIAETVSNAVTGVSHIFHKGQKMVWNVDRWQPVNQTQ